MTVAEASEIVTKVIVAWGIGLICLSVGIIILYLLLVKESEDKYD